MAFDWKTLSWPKKIAIAIPIAAVEQHAEACCNDNYRMGRRRQGVKMDEFVACVNESGTQFFSTTPGD